MNDNVQRVIDALNELLRIDGAAMNALFDVKIACRDSSVESHDAEQTISAQFVIDALIVRFSPQLGLEVYYSNFSEPDQRLERFAAFVSHPVDDPVRTIVSALNDVADRYGEGLNKLIEARVPCNKSTDDCAAPTCVDEHGNATLGVLGVINYIVRKFDSDALIVSASNDGFKSDIFFGIGRTRRKTT